MMFLSSNTNSFLVEHTGEGMEIALLHEEDMILDKTHHEAQNDDDDDATASTAFSDEDYSDDDSSVLQESCDDDSSLEFNAWSDSLDGSSMNDMPFRILGTSAKDASSRPHVLTPPIMEALQNFMPLCKTSDNFWMKYSMVRDGASMQTLLHHARGAKYAVLALETADGEVMGCFTNEPWRKTWNYFGGGEAFLWRMRQSRNTRCDSVSERARLESEIDVFPYTGENDCIQVCNSQQIAVGGGFPDQGSSLPQVGDSVRDHDWGYGLSLDSDLLTGTSSPCVTFGSPSLSKSHSDGSCFEIVNVELWTMTPCFDEADAQKLEQGQLFLEQQSFFGQSNEDLNKLYG